MTPRTPRLVSVGRVARGLGRVRALAGFGGDAFRIKGLQDVWGAWGGWGGCLQGFARARVKGGLGACDAGIRGKPFLACRFKTPSPSSPPSPKQR